MSPAPHLPPPACNIPLHTRLRTLPWLMVFVLLAFLAGLAGTLSAVAWLLPQAPLMPFFTTQVNRVEESTLEQDTIDDIESRLAHVYDKQKKIADNYYPKNASVGTLVLLTSDGWGVMSYPSYQVGQEKNWEIYDAQGNIRTIEKVIVDPLTKFLYVNLSGQGFRVVSFVTDESVVTKEGIWVREGDRYQLRTELRHELQSGDKAFAIWQPNRVLRFASTVNAAHPLFSTNGQFLGFTRDGYVETSWLIPYTLSLILEKGTPQYSGLLFDGMFVEKSTAKNRSDEFAFVVTQVRSKTKDDIKVGDVILRIQGNTFDADSLSRQILTAPQDMTLTILRAGKQIDVKVKKTIVL